MLPGIQMAPPFSPSEHCIAEGLRYMLHWVRQIGAKFVHGFLRTNWRHCGGFSENLVLICFVFQLVLKLVGCGGNSPVWQQGWFRALRTQVMENWQQVCILFQRLLMAYVSVCFCSLRG